ncbi:MAG TPA: hypothetical protein VLW75_04385 [Rhizomicrobium sp.]|nr:hypothetical protein [Rhizomicrobium sp.]
MTQPDEFEYEVAFSFIASDESIAIKNADLLRDRFRVFVYSEQQKKLAGRDGEEAFAKVFAKQARVVVIFFRQEWGKTPWTRIEETAIRGRAHDQGYDFTLWVPLDKSADVPAWVPKTRLWYNLERFGDTGLRAVIEQLIQEQGGDTKPETLHERSERMQREIKLGDARSKLIEGYDLSSAQTVAASAKEISDGIVTWVENGGLPDAQVRRHGTYTLLISDDRTPRAPACLLLRWTQPYRNHIGPKARIIATIYEGTPEFPGLWVVDQPIQVEEFNFAPDLNYAFEICWKKNGDDTELSPQATIDMIAMRFMNAIVRLSEPKR